MQSDTCVSWDKMCPMGPTMRPPEDKCPQSAPHSCWKTTKQLTLTTYPKTCYSAKERQVENWQSCRKHISIQYISIQYIFRVETKWVRSCLPLLCQRGQNHRQPAKIYLILWTLKLHVRKFLIAKDDCHPDDHKRNVIL